MANRQPGYIDGRRLRVGNIPTWGPVPNVLIPGTEEAYGIFEDFLSCEDLAAGGVTPTGRATWQFRFLTAGTIDQADEVGGAVVLAAPAADDRGAQIIMGSLAGGGIFFPLATKHIWFEARAKVTIETASAFNHFIGLIDPVDADILTTGGGGGAMPNQDIIGFFVWDGQVNWAFCGDESTTQTVLTLGAARVVDNDYHYFGFYVNGVTSVTCYYDREVVAAGALTGTNIPLTGLMPAFAVKSGNAAGLDSLTIDYVMCVQLR